MASSGIDHIVMGVSNLAATRAALRAAGNAVIDGGPLRIASRSNDGS